PLGCSSSDDDTYSHEDGKGPPPRLGIAIDISKNTRHNSNRGAPGDATDEAKDEQGRPVGREATGHGEEGEDGKGDDAQVAAAYVLADGTPDHGTNDVADEVDGDGKHTLLGGGDGPFLGHGGYG